MATRKQYYMAIFRQSFTLWGRAERLINFLRVVIGAILLVFFLAVGIGIVFKQEATWWVGGALFLGFLYLILFESQYRIWKRDKESIEKFSADRLPKLRIGGPSASTQPKGAAGKAVRIFGVKVENISTSVLRNCCVREAEFVNRFGQNSGMKRYFRMNQERYADEDAHTYQKKFDLQGNGASEIIDICMLDETAGNGIVKMLYAESPENRSPSLIDRKAFPHTLTISAIADDMAVPEKLTCKINISSNGYLTMRKSEQGPTRRLRLGINDPTP